MQTVAFSSGLDRPGEHREHTPSSSVEPVKSGARDVDEALLYPNPGAQLALVIGVQPSDVEDGSRKVPAGQALAQQSPSFSKVPGTHGAELLAETPVALQPRELHAAAVAVMGFHGCAGTCDDNTRSAAPLTKSETFTRNVNVGPGEDDLRT